MTNAISLAPKNNRSFAPSSAQTSTSVGGEKLLMNAADQWRTRPDDQRFESIETLSASVEARRNKSRTMDLDPAKIKVETAGGDKLAFNGALVKAHPNNWSFSQISQLAGAPAGYLATLPAPIIGDALRFGLGKRKADGETKDVRFMVADRDEGDASDLLAVTSTTYGRIWDADVVRSTRSLLSRIDVPFHNPLAYYPDGTTRPGGLYASDRDIFMFFVSGGDGSKGGATLDDGKSELNRGFFIWNSETGSKSFGIMSFMFRVTCLNNIVWGAESIKELRIRHSVGAPDRFINEAMPALEKYAKSSFADDARLIKAAQAFDKIPVERDEAIAWLMKRGFSKPEANGALRHAEAEEGGWGSLWDVVNGATAYARTFPHIDARTDLERRAGKLIELVA